MVATRNNKYVDSTLIYSRYHDGTKKFLNSNFLHFRGTKCRVEANNRETVGVCARHVVKRPSYCSAVVFI